MKVVKKVVKNGGQWQKWPKLAVKVSTFMSTCFELKRSLFVTFHGKCFRNISRSFPGLQGLKIIVMLGHNNK